MQITAEKQRVAETNDELGACLASSAPGECAFRRPSTASTTSATSTPQAGLLQAVMCRLRERIEALTHEVAELRDENMTLLLKLADADE